MIWPPFLMQALSPQASSAGTSPRERPGTPEARREMEALTERLFADLKPFFQGKGVAAKAALVHGEIRISNGSQTYDQPERAGMVGRAIRLARVEGPVKGGFQLMIFIEPVNTFRQMVWGFDRERVYGTECLRTVNLPGSPYRVMVRFRYTEPPDRSLLDEILKLAASVQQDR